MSFVLNITELALSNTRFVFNMIQFVLGTKGFVRNMTGLVPFCTQFLLTIIVINMTRFVLCNTGLVLNITEYVLYILMNLSKRLLSMTKILLDLS